MIELPVTIKKTHAFFWPEHVSFRNIVKQILYSIKGQSVWLRPNGNNLKQMKWLVKNNKNNDYVMFMIHSSELMPGGSPTFKTMDSIEKLYSDLENLFSYAASMQYRGITLKEYYDKFALNKDY